MIRAVIFDVGGVLKTDTSKEIFGDIARAFEIKFELAKSVASKLLRQYEINAISEEELWKQFSQKVKKNLPTSYEKLLIKKYISNYKKNDEVWKIVKKLKPKYLLIALSNTIPPHAQYNRVNGVFRDFDMTILSCEVKSRKPEEKIYRLPIKKLGLEPENFLYIDDKPKYLLPAKKVGMKTFHYQSPEQLKSGLKELKLLN